MDTILLVRGSADLVDNTLRACPATIQEPVDCQILTFRFVENFPRASLRHHCPFAMVWLGRESSESRSHVHDRDPNVSVDQWLATAFPFRMDVGRLFPAGMLAALCATRIEQSLRGTDQTRVESHERYGGYPVEGILHVTRIEQSLRGSDQTRHESRECYVRMGLSPTLGVVTTPEPPGDALDVPNTPAITGLACFTGLMEEAETTSWPCVGPASLSAATPAQAVTVADAHQASPGAALARFTITVDL
jgi:hypothetical protein